MDNKEKLRAIRFDKDSIKLEILDQLVIPYKTSYISIESIDDAFNAIKKMQVRGAPAIAIVGSFAVAIEAKNVLDNKSTTVDDLIKRIDYLVTSRPTAVNLSNSCTKIKQLILQDREPTDLVNEDVLNLILSYSTKLFEDDLTNNIKIGENGVKFIKESLRQQNFTGPFSIITICNTGSLATSGHGTALGIIRSTFECLSITSGEEFWLEKVYPCETRPYNQGSRLTTYELKYEQIPFTLICDNMVTSLISSLNNNSEVKALRAPIKFVIVGADRIVKNGDTANKIGTYQLAAIVDFFNSHASENDGIKFIVAAPRTTLDLKTESGDQIEVEERPSNELTNLSGPMLVDDSVGEKTTVGIATPNISVWNPAFDITPHNLIHSIITENVIYKLSESKSEFKF
ncbi:uncharacterized protein PRCAT00004959001 [Priceomyces carsonii]|uniref:uncharacterized protein n=1 Tax=Priceomyces carsonii TaxID=28549 RepID=UPI002ED8B682|nr:unnamed protein product [Priceomyces carsonii]